MTGVGKASLRQAAAVAAAALAAAALSSLNPSVTPLDGVAEDVAAAVSAAVRPDVIDRAGVVVVAVDPRSLAAPEARDLPRALMGPIWAETATRAFQAGARGVAFDLVFAFDAAGLTVDGATPLRRWDDPLLRLLLREGRAGRLVIATSQGARPARRFAQVAGPAGLAVADLPIDVDGVVRRAPLHARTRDGGSAPTLTGAMLRAAGAANPPAVVGLAAPRALDAVPTVSLIDVLRCDRPEALAAVFADRVVFVGGVAPGEDRRRGPDRFMPRGPADRPTGGADACAFARPETRDADADARAGVFLHASAVQAVLDGAQSQRLGPAWSAAVAGAGAGVGGVVASLAAPRVGAGLLAAIAVAMLAAAAAALQVGIVAPLARGLGGLAAGFGVALTARAALADRQAALLRDSFGRYLAPQFVDRLVEQDRPPRIEGENRDIAIMFADLSGFTALSERLDSLTLTAAVNRYLAVVAEEIDSGGGYVDKFIGDAAMGLWNAPIANDAPAEAAAETAWRLAEAVAALGAADRAAGRPAFALKVAVAAGPATVGNVGHEARMTYTALGPSVNLAARLEALPGVFGAPVVFDAAVAARVRDRFVLLHIADEALKGVSAPVAVHTPLRRRGVDLDADAACAARAARFDAAREAMAEGRLHAAAALWEALAAEEWPGAAPAAAMLARARAALGDADRVTT